MDKYLKLEKIQYGGYEDVYRGGNIVTREEAILKELRFPNAGEGVPSSIIKEISFSKDVEHSNIVRLLDVVNAEGKDSVYLVYEYMDYDLKQFMEKYPEIAKDPVMKKSFLLQILHAVGYYHSHNILYRDLKPQNFWIDSRRYTLKLADLGWTRAFGGSSETYDNEDATRCYKAPELLLQRQQVSAPKLIRSQQVSTPSDVWSVGCIFAEMVRQRPLFRGATDLHRLVSIFSIMGTPNEENWPGVTSAYPTVKYYTKTNPKNLAEFVHGLEPAGVDLLSKMLCLNPSLRITATEALQHAYLKNVRFQP